MYTMQPWRNYMFQSLLNQTNRVSGSLLWVFWRCLPQEQGHIAWVGEWTTLHRCAHFRYVATQPCLSSTLILACSCRLPLHRPWQQQGQRRC